MAPILRALLPGCLVFLSAGPVRADIVYLKDGTILYGRVVQDTTVMVDKETGQTLPIPKGNNVFAIVDGTRAIIFSPHQLDPNRPPEKTDTFAKLIKFDRKPSVRPYQEVPPGNIRGKLEFDDNGRRKIEIYNERGRYEIPQMLSFLSPYQMRIFSLQHRWTQNYLTAELSRDVARALAANFPQLKDEKDPVEKRMKWNRFMVEAKWYDDAAKDLDDIEKALPEAKARVQAARAEVQELAAQQTIDFAAHALDVGQLSVCDAFLSELPKQGLAANANVKANTLRVKVDGIKKQYQQAQHFLRKLPDEAEGPYAEILCEAASVIRDELHIEALDRLQPFLDLAEQAERAIKAGRVPADKPEQLLARAVSGWLLGKESADGRPEVARKLWRARQMVADYIRLPLLRDRNDLLARYEKGGPVEIDELARIIALLPPAGVEDVPPGADVISPQQRKTSSPNATDYFIQLPPEYKPGRPYPLLVVLHSGHESPKKILERCRYEAIRNGYILVAPEWGTGFGGPYAYTAEERQHVLDVIRDVRLHFHVDADRVFLSGYSEGGNAAWDVGLSHPDLFAAVVPMSADPKPSLLTRYWTNATHVPFYVVGGEYGGQYMKQLLKIMEYWVNKGFPCLNVMYQGRGREWYHAEVTNAFEWMNRRKRVNPFPELGRWPAGERTALATMRPSNNQFYWMTVESIKDGNLQQDNRTPDNAAQLQAIIRPGNVIEARTFGLKEFTVWLAPGMIDFSKPVSVNRTGALNRNAPVIIKNLKPDLSLMMETFLERGDNSRLFVAKIPLTP